MAWEAAAGVKAWDDEWSQRSSEHAALGRWQYRVIQYDQQTGGRANQLGQRPHALRVCENYP
jgi:hypothetical protein